MVAIVTEEALLLGGREGAGLRGGVAMGTARDGVVVVQGRVAMGMECRVGGTLPWGWGVAAGMEGVLETLPWRQDVIMGMGSHGDIGMGMGCSHRYHWKGGECIAMGMWCCCRDGGGQRHNASGMGCSHGYQRGMGCIAMGMGIGGASRGLLTME